MNGTTTADSDTEGAITTPEVTDRIGIPRKRLARESGDGSGTRSDDKRDEFVYTFPDQLPDDQYTSAKTTLRSFDLSKDQRYSPDRTRLHVNDDRTEDQRYTELWKLNHGLGSWGSDDDLDEAKSGLRVDPALRDQFLACSAVVDNLELPRDVRAKVVSRGANFQSGSKYWNRWYSGCVGLTLGHTIVALYDSIEEAKQSPRWNDIERICQSISINPEKLADRAFKDLGETGGK